MRSFEKIRQEIGVLDDKISAEEVELLEKKQAKKLWKEMKKNKVEECRDTVVAGCGFTQKAAAGSRSSEAEGDLFFVRVGSSLKKATEEGHKSFGQAKAPPRKRRAVVRVESAETQNFFFVSTLPAIESHGADK